MTMEDRYAGLVRSASALSSRGFVIQKILKAWGHWQETDERKSQQEDIGRGVESPQSLSRRFLEEHKNRRQACNALIHQESLRSASLLVAIPVSFRAQAVDGGHITI